MNNLKKFLGNKNTVTILGVIICVAILYVGYNYQISKVASLVEMPVATQDIQPRTLITDNLVKVVKVPSKLLEGSFYTQKKDIVGKYSNYNSMIAQGSLFYKSLLIEAKNMPNAAYVDVPDGYTVVSYKVNMDVTYANSMEPESYIDIYFKALSDEEDKIMFGKFVRNVKILAVKDSSGQNVFESSEEARTPAYLFFAVPDEVFELLKKAQYIANDYNIEFTLVPNTVELTKDDVVSVSSEEIRDYIMDKTYFIEDTNIKLEDDAVITRAEEEELKNKTENNDENNTNTENNNQ